MGLVESILGRGKAPPTSSSIRAELAKAERAAETARQDLEDARDAYQTSLLSEDEAESGRAKASIAACEVEVDRADALVAALRQRFEQQCETEAERERTDAYEAALHLKADAQKRLAEYDTHAAEITRIIREAAEAEVAVRRANDDLPANANRISGVEVGVRHAPSIPRKVLDERVEDGPWFYVDGPFPGTEVETFLQSSCRASHPGGRIGTVERRSRDSVTPTTCTVVRRHIRVTRYVEPVRAGVVESLASSVSLPPLRYGEAAHWSPAGAASHVNGGDHGAAARQVLAAAEKLEAKRAKGPNDTRSRQEAFKRELLEEPELLAEAARYAAERA